ncbi:alpha/beta hydrolase [Paenarthrobacter sp. Z7-10]|uniref:alpha/beta hydrolase n=1 Tax=Paenarthrobacter sp. Z7-10 TaxID=2787635 RepID=UPI0022A8D6A6|nr:alpha/beta hydrolase [Paenarthrobacter sp. Z7-10]MCZ2402243.1 alpha/beta hydrolase [Paenarthrobacter sp. Z7-10]
MIEKQTQFFSEGSSLKATLYYPEGTSGTEPQPALIINSGYQGFNEFYPKMFARQMTERGYVCLGFDYRGMADSEGEKGTVLIEEQVQDIRNAVTFMQSQDDVDSRQLGLIGWGMGAANVILAAEKARNVAGVASLNGFYDGERWLKSIHSYDEFARIVDEVQQDRLRRVLDGESKLADTFAHYPLDPATDDYVQKELAQVYGFGHPTRLQFTESIMDLNVEKVVKNLSPTPLFIGHGSRNSLHPYDEAVALFASAASPKTLYTVDGRHNDFMYSDHPEFLLLCDRLKEFFDQAFALSASPSRSVSA